jgi:hypothetical protein
MYHPGYHTTSAHAFTRDKHTINLRFRVWAAGPVRRPIRRRHFPRFLHTKPYAD